MTESSLSPPETESPPRAIGVPSRAAGDDQAVNRIADALADLETFRTEVAEELASIRALLHGSFDLQCAEASPQRHLPPDRSTFAPRAGREGRSERTLLVERETASPADALAGHDRLTALKQRLAARLHTDTLHGGGVGNMGVEGADCPTEEEGRT
ncbi:MAG: hypothetical protein KF861_09215 [Planctomycetaceae bacterium]|nr:hypothetical protein [Planctomycetaceae bacterium]